MATGGYTTYDKVDQNTGGVAGDFIKRQNERVGWGIRNISTESDQTKRTGVERFVKNSGERISRIGKQMKEEALAERVTGGNSLINKAKPMIGSKLDKFGRITRASSRGFAFRKGKVGVKTAWLQVSLAMGWTGILSAIALGFGILTLAALGMVATIQFIINSSPIPGTQTVADYALWMFNGTDTTMLWIFAIACLILYWFLIISMFLGAYLQLKLGGLQPIHGRASGVKTLTLVGALVISAIPGANVVPWIWIWLFAVALFPN